MKKTGKLLLGLTLALCCTSCGTSVENGDSKEGIQNGKELLMVYMAGSDLESRYGQGSQDIQEIIESDYDTEKMDVLVCTGGSSTWENTEISGNGSNVYLVTGDGITPCIALENDNMADPKTLTEFLDYGYQNYPAEYYSLVLWDHGGGALVGFGADENYETDVMTMEELDAALSDSRLYKAKSKLEWVGFDASLMGMLEVANLLQPYANYLIASEEMAPGEGWDYTSLDRVSSSEFSGEITAEILIDSYGRFYEENYDCPPDYTLSCMDLSGVKQVADAFDGLTAMAQQEMADGGYSLIARQRSTVKSFGKVTSSSFYDSVDVYDLAEKMKALYPEEADALQQAVAELVVCAGTNVSGAHGVATYFPYENQSNARAWIDAYEGIRFSDSYLEFITAFQHILDGEALGQWSLSGSIPEQDSLLADTYSLALTKEQMDNYGKASFSIWEEVEGRYIRWISTMDAALSKDDVLSSSCEYRKFYLRDDSGTLVSCTAQEIERNESYVKYAVPIMISRTDQLVTQWGYLHVKVEQGQSDGQVIGVYRKADTQTTLFPERQMIQIQEGDIIYPVYETREVVLEEDGTIAPFDQWKSSISVEDGFAVSGTLQVQIETRERQLENTESLYQCQFTITDTQGKTSDTNLLEMQENED